MAKINPDVKGYVVTCSINGHLASHYTPFPWQAFVWILEYAKKGQSAGVIELATERFVNYHPDLGFQVYK
jgi:hypothetical protein